jgi:hypothetical protein
VLINEALPISTGNITINLQSNELKQILPSSINTATNKLEKEDLDQKIHTSSDQQAMMLIKLI